MTSNLSKPKSSKIKGRFSLEIFLVNACKFQDNCGLAEIY